eukprot:g28794.t1
MTMMMTKEPQKFKNKAYEKKTPITPIILVYICCCFESFKAVRWCNRCKETMQEEVTASYWIVLTKDLTIERPTPDRGVSRRSPKMGVTGSRLGARSMRLSASVFPAMAAGEQAEESSKSTESSEPCKVCSDEISPVRTATPASFGCLAYAHSECPVNRKELGRATWAFLHTLAAYYPENPSPRLQEDVRQFMHIMGRIYPCGYCADRTAEEIERNPPRVENHREFATWMCEVHNEVNERMGKPIFDCSTVDQRWRYGPSDGSCRRPQSKQKDI